MTLAQLRRLGKGAVLTLFYGLFACGGDDNLSAPETPIDQGAAPAAGCTDGVLDHGALYQICFPGDWNGDMVLYAHGYVAPGQDLALPTDEIGGQSISSTVNGLGYAYATTSYRANGLVAPEAVEDLVELDATVRRLYRPDPAKTVVVGVSEGGLVAALAAERHPDRFDGALAACGPVGDIQRQLEYFVNFRIVFDYLFPGELPGSAIDVPDSVRAKWSTSYVPAVALALVSRPGAARELVSITGAPVERNDIVAITETALGVLWYNVYGTADAQQRLGGQPFDNSTQVYSGSSDDAALNAGVARYRADASVLPALAEFQTSGNITVPIVTLHTTGDPIVPFEQESLYAAKVSQAGAGARLTQIPVERYGHCNFQPAELLGAFTTLIDKIPQAVATAADRG